MFKNAKILFYFSQYYKLRLEEGIYRYNSKLEVLGFLRAFLALLKHALKKDTTRKIENGKLKGTYKNMVYIETINQKNAIIDVFSSLKEKDKTLFYLNDLNGKLNIPDYDQKDFPNQVSFRMSIFLIFKSLLISRKYIKTLKSKVNSNHILLNLSIFMASIKIFENELKSFKIQKVILTNDHNLHTLALLLASRNLQIPTFYLQHAAVSPAFPKLLAYNALLEGQQAVNIYNEMGNLAKNVFLVGIPRMDGVLGYKKELKSNNITVGFCLKPYFTEQQIAEYIKSIKKVKTVARVIIRPHPSNGKLFYKKLEKYNLEISNARVERPHEFLKQLDVLISGESSIILESTLMRVKTLYIDDKFANYDLYGFVKNKIATPVNSIAELHNELELLDYSKVNEQYNNAQYYCSTVNTAYENKSKILIQEILKL